MDTIFNVNKPVKHTGRNGFDTSFSRVVSMRPSVVRPVKVYHTVPNSAYRINVADIVRTGALQTAAFLRGKQELDVYFVPYSQLYSRANDVVLERGDEQSVSINQLDGRSFPSVSLAGLILNATIPYFWLRFVTFYKEKTLQYWDVNKALPHDWKSTVEDMYHYFHQVFYEGTSLPYNSNLLDDLFYNSGITNTSFFLDEEVSMDNFVNLVDSYDWLGADCLALLSTCDYGDYYSTMKTYFDESVKIASSDFDREDWLHHPDLFIPYCTTVIRFARDFLHDFLLLLDPGYDWYRSGSYKKLVSLIPLAAYQKVWKDNYRDSICDDSNLYLYASNLDYNSDDLITSVLAPVVSEYDNLRCLKTFLRPRLRAMRRDISNGIYPNPQFGDPGTTPAILDYSQELNIPDEGGASSDQSAVAIQFALALQRYRQTLLRAGNRTKDLLMAEYGVKSHYVNDTYPHYVGSFSGDLELNRVSSTAESGTYSVGDLAGNVFSSLQGNELEFTSNDHGCLVFCFSFIADPLHNAYGISPFNLKLEPFDFFKEDFENLGLQPVSSHLFTPFVQDVNNPDLVTSDPLTLGFGARYNEYKQNFDTVHDDFTTHAFVPYKDSNDDYFFQLSVNGAATNYVMVRDIIQTVSLMKDRSYLMPSCMDTIFKVLDSGYPEDNHFEVAMQFNIKAVLPMSTLGLI